MSNSWYQRKVAEFNSRPAPATVVPAQVPAGVPQQVRPGFSSQPAPQPKNMEEAIALANAGLLQSYGDPQGAARENAGACPNCGSALFSGGHNGTNGVFNSNSGMYCAPATMCGECGFNSKYGSQLCSE